MPSYVRQKTAESGMRYRNERVHMGLGSLSEFECYRTDEAEIRRAAWKFCVTSVRMADEAGFCEAFYQP
ncbi:MAG: hypothetical protein ACLUD2_17645 [Clostridium sp.]